MSNYSYTLIKISWLIFNKNYWQLTDEQKSKVLEIYNNNY